MHTSPKSVADQPSGDAPKTATHSFKTDRTPPYDTRVDAHNKNDAVDATYDKDQHTSVYAAPPNGRGPADNKDEPSAVQQRKESGDGLEAGAASRHNSSATEVSC